MSLLLLDTHVLLWWLADDRRLSKDARETIADPDTVVYVSAATAWEISIKKTLGRLAAPDDLGEQLHAQGFKELPVTVADGLAAGALPRHHDDPFDRTLVAQAQNRGLTLVTSDPDFASYGIVLLRA